MTDNDYAQSDDALARAAAEGPLPGHFSGIDDNPPPTREDVQRQQDGVIPAPAYEGLDRPVADGSDPAGNETVGGVSISSGLTG